MRRAGRWAVLVVVVAVVAAGAFWAGRVTTRPAAVASDLPQQAVVVTVTKQSVGKVLHYNTTVTQPRRAVATNALTGVVTQVSASGTFSTGDLLYTVAGRQVRVIAGKTPFYRDLVGGESGSDVAELRKALHELGFLSSGSGSRMDAAAREAVRDWQRKLGRPVTGTIMQGELVAVAKLPAKLVIDASVARKAAVLSGGEQIVFTVSGTPSFVMAFSSDQARLVPSSAKITVHSGDHNWPAVITKTATAQDGTVNMTLAAPGGGSVCGKDCGTIPPTGQLYLLSDIEVVPSVSGPAVPVAAITVQADGTATVVVVDDAGHRSVRTVTVKGSQDGVAIVSGVKVGERVEVLGGSGPAGTEPGASSPAPSSEETG